jgi:hypothetical protein
MSHHHFNAYNNIKASFLVSDVCFSFVRYIITLLVTRLYARVMVGR